MTERPVAITPSTAGALRCHAAESTVALQGCARRGPLCWVPVLQFDAPHARAIGS